jgi:hypothetical protein
MTRAELEGRCQNILSASRSDTMGNLAAAYDQCRELGSAYAAEAKAEQDEEWIASLRDHMSKGWPKSGRHLFNEGCNVCRALSPPVAAQ